MSHCCRILSPRAFCALIALAGMLSLSAAARADGTSTAADLRAIPRPSKVPADTGGKKHAQPEPGAFPSALTASGESVQPETQPLPEDFEGLAPVMPYDGFEPRGTPSCSADVYVQAAATVAIELNTAAIGPDAFWFDDLTLAGTERQICNVRVRLQVGTNAAPFSITLVAYTACPTLGGARPNGNCNTGPGTVIAGFPITINNVTIPVNTALDIDIPVPSVTVPNTLFMGLRASRAGVFWQLGGTPTTGTSQNQVGRCASNAAPNGCNLAFAPPTVNNFFMRVTANAVPPANDQCANAAPLTVVPGGTTTVNGTTTNSTADANAIDCGDGTVDANGVWYSVPGTGNTMTATTCGAGTNFDTQLIVYCGTCECTICVDGNDDADGNCTPATASRVSWCSRVGVTYRIFVTGFNNATGNFALTVSDNGQACTTSAACTTTPPTCADDLNTTGVYQEMEPCGQDTNGGCNAPGGAVFEQVNCGDRIYGSAFLDVNSNSRDTDWFTFTTGADQVIEICVTSEFPAQVLLLDFTNGTCQMPIFELTGSADPCVRTCLRTMCEAPRQFVLFIAPVAGSGNLPCDSTCRSGNNYFAEINCLPCLGACCLDACPYTCRLVLEGDCNTNGTVPETFHGVGSTCAGRCADQLLPPCCHGDSNGDGRILGDDIQTLVNAIINAGGNGRPDCGSLEYCRVDVNNDSVIDALDALALADKLVNSEDCSLDFDCGDSSRCQQADRQPHGAGETLAAFSDRGGLFGPEGFWAADDFEVTSTGSISEICWSGIYVNLFDGSDCGGSIDDDFQVTYYNADGANGRPGTVRAGPFMQAAATLEQVTRVATGNLVDDTYSEFLFRARHAAFSVTAGDCIWIEITNESEVLCTWAWLTAPAGNGLSLTDANTDVGPQYGDAGLNDFDLSFCVGPSPVTISSSGCPIPAPANDNCADAIAVGNGTVSFTTIGATNDGPVETAAGCGVFDANARDVWYCYTATCTGDVIVDLCDSSYDTIIAVYNTDASCTCPSGPGAIACNDDSAACGATALQSQVGFSATSGNRYLIRIAGFNGGIGDGSMTISCAVSPCNDPTRCQISDGMGHGAGGNLAATSDRNIGTSQEGFFVADDFQPATNGVITQLCWWGIYRDFGAGADCSAGAVDDFQVVYYNANGANGRPGTVRAGPFLQSANSLTGVTRNPSGRTLAIHPEFRYEAQHAPVNVTAGECVWIEITNLSTPACTWLWSTAPAGNSRALQDTDPFPGAQYATAASVDFDLGFCVGPTPIAISPSSCAAGLPGDECATAITLACGGTDSRTADDFSFSAMDPLPSCTAADMGTPFPRDKSWWYRFTTGAGINNVDITMCATTPSEDLLLALYTGACGSLTEVACDDDTCTAPAFGPSRIQTSVTPNTQYFVQVQRYSGGTGGGNPQVSITVNCTP